MTFATCCICDACGLGAPNGQSWPFVLPYLHPSATAPDGDRSGHACSRECLRELKADIADGRRPHDIDFVCPTNDDHKSFATYGDITFCASCRATALHQSPRRRDNVSPR